MLGCYICVLAENIEAGGGLGMLSEKSVSFVMATDDLVSVDLRDNLSRVRKVLGEGTIHHVPVLEAGKLVGIVSSADLLRLGVGIELVNDDTLDGQLDARFTIAEVMETSLVTLRPKDPLLRAAKLLLEESFNSLPVVDEQGELVGVLTIRDMLRYAVQQDPGASSLTA